MNWPCIVLYPVWYVVFMMDVMGYYMLQLEFPWWLNKFGLTFHPSLFMYNNFEAFKGEKPFNKHGYSCTKTALYQAFLLAPTVRYHWANCCFIRIARLARLGVTVGPCVAKWWQFRVTPCSVWQFPIYRVHHSCSFSAWMVEPLVLVCILKTFCHQYPWASNISRCTMW